MIVDVILVLILVALTLSGYRKGLLMSLMGLAVTVLCCLGAAAAQRTLTPRVQETLTPWVTEALEPEIQSQVTSATQGALEDASEVGLTVGSQALTLDQVAELLENFGLDVEAGITDGVTSAMDQSGATHAIAAALAEAIVEKVAGVVIFFGAYLILYLVLHSVMLAVNVVDHLPMLHTFNHAGGGILGLGMGLVVMVVAAAVLDRAGLLSGEMGPFSQLLIDLSQQVL